MFTELDLEIIIHIILLGAMIQNRVRIIESIEKLLTRNRGE